MDVDKGGTKSSGVMISFLQTIRDAQTSINNHSIVYNHFNFKRKFTTAK